MCCSPTGCATLCVNTRATRVASPDGLLLEGDVVGGMERCEVLQRCASVSVLPRLQPVGLLSEGDVVGGVELCEGVATSCVGVRVTEVAALTGCCGTVQHNPNGSNAMNLLLQFLIFDSTL